MQKILIIDDESDIRDVLADIIEDEGYQPLKAAHSEQALALFKAESPDLIILDIWLENSDMDGIEILTHLKKKLLSPCPVLMISGHGNIEMAVKAMKIGAYDFIEKPFKIDHILMAVERALEKKRLTDENTELRQKMGMQSVHLTAHSQSMGALLKEIEPLILTDARVLITAQRGAGKSRLVDYMISGSHRAMEPVKRLSGGDLTVENVPEFLGNENLRQGTLVIDHIHLIPMAVQTCLLNYLTNTQGKALPRIISTALPSIKDMVSAGTFQSALYDRLAVGHIHVPSLDQRRDDIPELVNEFAVALCKDLRIPTPSFTSDAILILQDYEWSGNIRQLKLCVEWTILSKNMSLQNDQVVTLTGKDFDCLQSSTQVMDSQGGATVIPLQAKPMQSNASDHQDVLFSKWLDIPLREAREQFERYYLTLLLKRFVGNISHMASHIDMERTALHRKLKMMNIQYQSLDDMDEGNSPVLEEKQR